MSEYVLITAAHNEEDYIVHLIDSVLSQTNTPLIWVIVSDGSTDRTDEIINSYSSKFDWIHFMRMPVHIKRDFASKSFCINAAWESLIGSPFDYVAICDADISFESDYVKFLLDKFIVDPALGIVGTPFLENGYQFYDYRFTNVEHVSGGFQFFRRECFEEIGGYTPVRTGGEDWIAVTTARMKGWKTRTFLEKSYKHLRPMGTADKGVLLARFASGFQDYLFGNHPIWELFRTIYQMRSGPIIIGGLLILAGYLSGYARKPERPISKELIRFLRNEQIGRLNNLVASKKRTDR